MEICLLLRVVTNLLINAEQQRICSSKQGGMKTFILFNSHLTDSLLSLFRCLIAASLNIFYHCFHANFSSDLVNCISSILPPPRCTRLSTFFHPYSVDFCNERVNQYFRSFILFSVNSGIPCLFLYIHLLMTLCVPRLRFQDIYLLVMSDAFVSTWAPHFYYNFCQPFMSLFYIKKSFH